MAREYKDSGIEWIGRIPKDWKVTKLFNLCTIKGRIGWNGLRSDEFKEKSFAYLVTGQDFVSSDINWKNCYQIGKERYDEDPCIQLSNGDILITKDGTIGKIAKVRNMDKPACLNSGIFVLKQRKGTFDQNYLYWYLVSPILLSYNAYVNSGGTTIMHLYQNVFERFPLIIPTISEQQRIADYLDKKCAEIDSLVELQEQMIAQLTDYKQSVITEAVTKGLNPEAELVPSGIDWIGDVPKGWAITKVKWQLNERKERSERGKEEPLSMSQKYGLIPTKEMDVVPNMASSFVGAKLVYKGDLVFNKLKAHLGVFAVSKFDGLVSPDYAVYSKRGNCSMKYLEYLFKTPQYIAEFRKLSTGVGAGLTRLYTDDLFSISCIYPPANEQESIALYIQEKCHEIDTLISIKRQKIETLKDYKKSIIFEAVTGKTNID